MGANPFRIVFTLAASLLAMTSGMAQTPRDAAQHCLAAAANRPSFRFGEEDDFARKAAAWAKMCREAESAAGTDATLALAIAEAYIAADDKIAAAPFYKIVSANGDGAQLFQVFERHRSWDQGDLAKFQVVTRAQADAALRKAADLGNEDAIVALAVRLERGEIVRRDPVAARAWYEKMRRNAPKGWLPAEIETRIGNLLTRSADPEERMRGMQMLQSLVQRGYDRAKVGFAILTRAIDPARARELLVSAMRADPGAAAAPLAAMMMKGEGGPADVKRGLALLENHRDVPGVRLALGRLYIEGRFVPQDIAKGVALIWSGSAFDLDGRIETTRLLARYPQVRLERPAAALYEATMNAELDEPGARDALVALKLSENPQYRDVDGACRLMRSWRPDATGLPAECQ